MGGEKSYKRFYQTDIWQIAFELLKKVYSLSLKFPDAEKYALTNQIRRSSNSVLANTAEAHGRFYFKDRIRVFYIVRGELEETQSHLWVAYSQKYINKDEFLQTEKNYENLKVKINNQINNWHEQNKK
ncbi:MAG: four helix bundle protein [Candidatus Magasanikbacteria bacterium CG10_big_fil_rev_8_21_14_0_10_36_16]|uniref:Four helix bundle protein n=1 Tax=Candidatus Magasanikbacteria bacterium CG10_big_fil_rev_8_21_14_0_10_36_16 TaxID=1974645 RepID=A0A2H0TY30_9BACT|nr:MAG: four helix bundle protein [Candidatus Magasanikbacteria bacterium CG10_big_fil_rev_8_21_14_0_10_36_16]